MTTDNESEEPVFNADGGVEPASPAPQFIPKSNKLTAFWLQGFAMRVGTDFQKDQELWDAGQDVIDLLDDHALFSADPALPRHQLSHSQEMTLRHYDQLIENLTPKLP